MTLRGLNFTGASVTTPSASLTLQNVVVVDDETITLDVVVAAGATVNTSHTITATVGMQSSNVSFRVVSANAPFIVAVRPPFGNRGDTVAIVLEGVHLSGVVPGTGVDLSGPKIIESNATALDDQTVRAILSIDPTASIGGRDVTVTTATGSVTKTSAFRVNIPGQIPIITDVTPSVVLRQTPTSQVDDKTMAAIAPRCGDIRARSAAAAVGLNSTAWSRSFRASSKRGGEE